MDWFSSLLAILCACLSFRYVLIYFNKSMLEEMNKFDTDVMAKQFWAIGDPVRLEILRLLPSTPSCEEACNVSTIATRIGLSQPSVSHHLRVLRQAGIIMNEKRCRDMIYWVRPEALSELQAELANVLETQGKTKVKGVK